MVEMNYVTAKLQCAPDGMATSPYSVTQKMFLYRFHEREWQHGHIQLHKKGFYAGFTRQNCIMAIFSYAKRFLCMFHHTLKFRYMNWEHNSMGCYTDISR